MAHRALILLFLLTSHVTLQLSSSSYRHEFSRFLKAAASAPATWRNLLSISSEDAPNSGLISPPTSGVYASTSLLHNIQQHMRIQGSAQENSSTTVSLYSSSDLIAYTSASQVIQGQGWRARTAFYVMLLAPRFFVLTAMNMRNLQPELQLFTLAGADLPAVGLLSSSEDPSAGYILSCSSPGIDMGLGPQPLAKCTVLAPEPASSYERALQKLRPATDKAQASGVTAAADGRVAEGADANTAAALLGTDAASPSKDGSIGGDSSSSDGASSRQVLAVWTILPDQSPEGVAAQLRKSDLPQLPFLGGGPPESEPGFLAGLLDLWLLFPRAPLMQLIPAMTGLQQLLYAQAVLFFSYQDLLLLIRTVQHLQTRTVNQLQPFTSGGWSFVMAGLSVTLQLLMMMAVRTAVAALAAYASITLLLYVLRGVRFAATVAHLPVLRLLAGLLQLEPTYLMITDYHKAATVTLVSATAACAYNYFYEDPYDFWRPFWVSALGAASGFVGFAVIALLQMVLVGLTTGPTAQAAAAPAAQAATAASAGSSSSRTAAMEAASTAVQKLLWPWQPALLLLHSLCEDLVMLAAAWLVWELLELAADATWRAVVQLAGDAAVVVECAMSSITMVLYGASWQLAWHRFCVQLQQRLQQQQQDAIGGVAGEFQAQVFIQGHQAAFADVGHTADTLRALADELEQLDGAGGWQQPWGHGAGGHLVLQHRQPRGPRLGQHWPGALQFGFDADDVREELGMDVPRGFVCPLTLDIMKQPALLISSNIAVPSSYDRDAISRWLEGSRRDPKSRQLLASDAQLVPNFDLYRAIEDWVAHIQELRDRKHASAAVGAAAHNAQQQQDQMGAALLPGHADAAAAGPSAWARPSSSTGTVGSLLAAARGMMTRGTAAAAAAAAAATAPGVPGTRTRRQQRATAPANAARALDADSDSDGGMMSDSQEDEDAVESPAIHAAATASVATAATQQQQQQQHAGRYNLRRRSSVAGT